MSVRLVWKTHGCVIPTKVNGVSELSRITVATIQDIEGLDAKVYGPSFPNNGKTDVARLLGLDLELKASSELPLGQRMFLVRIDYDALDHSGTPHRERLFAPILIRVVGPNAAVKERYYSEIWTLRRGLLLPVTFLEYLGEIVTGQICC